MSQIGWSLSDAKRARGTFREMRRRVRYPMRAYDKMLDVVAERQREWFATEGQGTWAPRRGRYAAYMARHYPERKILHGPDRKGHKGGQLRKELTERPFGVEKMTSRGFRYGTELPYAKVHQQGLNTLPRRRPLKPVDAATVEKFRRIMARHIVVSRARYDAGVRP